MQLAFGGYHFNGLSLYKSGVSSNSEAVFRNVNGPCRPPDVAARGDETNGHRHSLVRPFGAAPRNWLHAPPGWGARSGKRRDGVDEFETSFPFVVRARLPY